jgi:arabinan endo-1,5-alpha-L-arabinosidase
MAARSACPPTIIGAHFMNRNNGFSERGKWVGMQFAIGLISATVLLTSLGFGQERLIHDPFIIKEGAYYYLVCTGHNIFYRRSTDLFHWQPIGNQGSVFAQPPKWAQEVIRRRRKSDNPEPNMGGGQIFFFNGKYHLYSGTGVWGTNDGVMGLVTNVTLDPDSPQYKWEDQGVVIQTKSNVDDFSSLGGMVNVDQEGKYWMVYGGWQRGIMLQQLDPLTGKLSGSDRKVYNLAARRDPSRRFLHGLGIEGPFLYWKKGYWYLFVSFDLCCKGANSTYNIRVGRSKDIRGPYSDRSGKPMLEGGGTLVLKGYDNVRGPGSNQIMVDNENEYHVGHWYDANQNGMPRLSVRPVVWDDDGWPLLGEMLTGPVQDIKKLGPDELRKRMPGVWDHSADFGPPARFNYLPDGTIEGRNATWELKDTKLMLRAPDSKAPGGTWTLDCTLSDDGSWYVCRSGSGDGIIVRGRKVESRQRSSEAKPEINPLLGQTPVTEESIRQSLVLHFTFDQLENDGKVTDMSGKENHGKAAEVGWTANGRKGGAYVFSADGSQVRVPDNNSLDSGQITLAVWIKTTSPGSGWRRVIDKSFSDGFAMSVSGEVPIKQNRGKVGFEIGPNHWLLSDMIVTDGQWHHLVATFDGMAQTLYIDGKPQGQVPRWSGRISANGFDLTIGCNRSNPPQGFGRSFVGTLDEPMIFSRALTPAEVEFLFELQ